MIKNLSDMQKSKTFFYITKHAALYIRNIIAVSIVMILTCRNVREKYIYYYCSVSQVIEFSSRGYKINCNISAKIDAIKTNFSKFLKWHFFITYECLLSIHYSLFVDKTKQCFFAFTPQANFPVSNLNFHWWWRWWDRIQATFSNLFYFILWFVKKGWNKKWAYLMISVS